MNFQGFWAIQPSLLREHFQSVQTIDGRPLKNARQASVRGKTAIIPIYGIITPHDNTFSQIFGFSTVETIAKDITAALKNREIKSILLDVHSGGGQIDGIHELSTIIRQSNTQKPIHAYIGAFGASAAYWLASAAQKVYIDKTASVGSVGVIYVDMDYQENNLVITSSNAPKKHLDPESEAGQKEILAQIDYLEDVFIADIAGYRGVSPDFIKTSFGQGGLVTGNQAVENKMADGLSSFEVTLTSLRGQVSMDQHEVNAIIAQNLEAFKVSDALRAEIDRQVEARIASLEERLKSAQVQARKDDEELEKQWVEDINGVFAMFEDETTRQTAYQKLRADCLAEKVSYREARNKIIQLRAEHPIVPAEPVAQAHANIPQDEPPPVQFEQKIQAFVEKGMTQAKAMQEAVHAYPELYKAWLEAQQQGG